VKEIKKLSKEDMIKFHETYIIPERLLNDEKKEDDDKKEVDAKKKDEKTKKESERSALVMIAMKNQDKNLKGKLTKMKYTIIEDLPTFKAGLSPESTSTGGSS
jgi:hypothetical protein